MESYSKNKTPAPAYYEFLKNKYPDEFDTIGVDILNQFTNEEVYMFINHIFELETTDTYDTQYMLIPVPRPKTILWGLNLFKEIHELKEQHKLETGELPKLASVKYLYTIERPPGPNGLEISLEGVSQAFELVTK